MKARDRLREVDNAMGLLLRERDHLQSVIEQLKDEAATYQQQLDNVESELRKLRPQRRDIIHELRFGTAIAIEPEQ